MKHWEDTPKEEREQIINDLLWTHNYRESLEFECANFPIDYPDKWTPVKLTGAEIKIIMEKDKV